MGMGRKEEKQKEELYKEKDARRWKEQEPLSPAGYRHTARLTAKKQKKGIFFWGDAMEVINPTFQIDKVGPLLLQYSIP